MIPRLFLALAAYVLAWPVGIYLAAQRHRFSRGATALPQEVAARFRGYFDRDDLANARIAHAARLPIPSAPFAGKLRAIGLHFLNSSQAAAITLDHIIVTREPVHSPSLLFHELVHVVQFRLLGIQRFARLYVRGFLAGGSYYRIPLERCAFELTRRFESGEAPFSVEAEVRNWIAQNRF